MSFIYRNIDSPVGKIFLVSNQQSLVALAFKDNWPKLKEQFTGLKKGVCPILDKTERQLGEYFSGQRKDFDLPTELKGTDFQERLWKSLAHIPYGKTFSYSEQAEKINNPLAVRAVGRTNGLNPISIIYPCHRVIGKSGKLTGYAGGIKAKAYLLELEREHTS
jgi:methylated-DNA-[protein]-cysteine S-methyltransferase